MLNLIEDNLPATNHLSPSYLLKGSLTIDNNSIESDSTLNFYRSQFELSGIQNKFIKITDVTTTKHFFLERNYSIFDSEKESFNNEAIAKDYLFRHSNIQVEQLSKNNDRNLQIAPVESTLASNGSLVVTNNNDSGLGSLRQAIEDANNNDGKDVIVFDSSLSGMTIRLFSGQLEITDELDLIGLESGEITIDAGGNSRVFSIDDGDKELSTEVTIENLTITGGVADGDNLSNIQTNSPTTLTDGLPPRVAPKDKGGGIANRENLTLVNSKVSGNFAFDDGGGIYNDGTLNLIDSLVTENSAFDGGGIANDFGNTLVATNSIIENNWADDAGGGILNFGSLSVDRSSINNNSAVTTGGGIDNLYGTIDITDSIISGNYVQFDGSGIDSENGRITLFNTTLSNNYAGDSGGGIRIVSSSLDIFSSTISGNSAGRFGGGIGNGFLGFTTIVDSTIVGNSTPNEGGGIVNFNSLELINSTVSGNLASDDGGGIASSGSLYLINSTVSGNLASDDGGGIFSSGSLYSTNSTFSGNLASGDGGGVFSSSFLMLANSIIANSAGGGDLYNTGEEVDVRGVNIIEDSSLVGDKILNADPMLSPLQDNGGSTFTHAPLVGSVAIDAGNNRQIPTDIVDLDGDGDIVEDIPFDQRGNEFDRVVNGTVDIGAVEYVDENTPQPGEVIFGTSGADELLGTNRDDAISGLLDRDILTGGGGSDTFFYHSFEDFGDTITDFNPNEDIISFNPLMNDVFLPFNSNTPFADYIDLRPVNSGTEVRIDLLGDFEFDIFITMATLEGVFASEITEDNFIF